MTDDPAWALARHVCRTGYADLPTSAVESARRDILDTFGCMLGGSGSPGIDELFAVISRWGGLAESRVLLRGVRLPAPQAALLNASMGHALDFDDTLDTGGSIHPGVSVLGAALAVCDSLGTVTGKELLLAVALGLDVSCRIALASTLDRGWHRTSAIGVFGADRGGRQAIAAHAGANAGRLRHCVQSRGRQPSMHSGRRADQADAGRPGGQCRRFLGGSGADRASPERTISLTAASGFSSCISRTATMPRFCFAIWARSSSGEGLSYKPYPVRPAVARGDRCRAGGTCSSFRSSGPRISRR